MQQKFLAINTNHRVGHIGHICVNVNDTYFNRLRFIGSRSII